MESVCFIFSHMQLEAARAVRRERARAGSDAGWYGGA